MPRAAERWGCWIDGRRFATCRSRRAAQREFERPYLRGVAQVMNLDTLEEWKRFGLRWRLQRAAARQVETARRVRG